MIKTCKLVFLGAIILLVFAQITLLYDRYIKEYLKEREKVVGSFGRVLKWILCSNLEKLRWSPFKNHEIYQENFKESKSIRVCTANRG